MKCILPRFFRCFLIAVLAAVVAVPLAPVGKALGDSIPCDDPPYFVDEGGVEPTAKVMAVITSYRAFVVGVSGTSFPARTALSALNVGSWDGLPSPPPMTDESGSFTVWLAVPRGSHGDGRLMVSVTVADVERSAPLILPCTEIGLSTDSARPGDTITITGTAFSAYSSIDAINFGSTSALPVPNPSTDGVGEFSAAVVVPTLSLGPYTITVRAGPVLTATTAIRIVGPEVTLMPDTAMTGQVITVSGAGFPARTALSEFRFGGANLLPSPPPVTDAAGSFTVPLTVPRCYSGGSGCIPGGYVVHVRVADVTGVAVFTYAWPSITLSTAAARPGDTITIVGRAFSAYANVSTINIGRANVTPAPNPLTDGVGNFTANVTVPPLDPGAYTVTVRTGADWSATASIRILSATVGSPVPAETAFQALTSRGLLTLAAAAPPGDTSFGAYVPGLPGDTLMHIEPEGVLILTLAEDVRISVSGQPAVDVAADTPTFFALGSDVSVEVVEHGA